MNIKKAKSIFLIFLPLILGSIIGFIIKDYTSQYAVLNKPFLSPPSFLFSIVWPLLYLLMGISAYFIRKSTSSLKNNALYIYNLQLLVNLLWSFVFFVFKNYLFAFIWLILLIVLVVYMIKLFYEIDKKAAYLQIFYLIWLLFAGYLNLGVYLLNR
ncbi:MAG: tryptophan-rich sensory protein [Bacilli bacterium]|nr:tryptophan-rich sensory protein [Bacilli bacterium]